MKTCSSHFLVLILAAFALFSCGRNDKTDYSVFPVKIGPKWGYVSTKGEYIVNPIFTNADHFSEGLARVEKDNRVGYISKKGKFVIPCEYLGGTSFSEGKAFVTGPEMCPMCIDKKGNILFKVDSVEYVYSFSEGYAVIVTADWRYGYINGKGKKVIEPRYTDAHNYSEGLAAVKEADRWGFINGKGEAVIDIQYPEVGDFKEGLAYVRADNGQYGYIDKKGNMVINPQFDSAFHFNDGLACVKTGDSYGFIDKNGHYVINPQFNRASVFSNGLAHVAMESYGFVNKKGRFVINPTYMFVSYFVGDYAFVYEKGKFGLIDKHGKMIVDPQFDLVATPEDNTVITRSNYYDADAFLTELFKDWKANSIFGFDSNTTLGDVRTKFIPQKGPEDNTYAFSFKNPKEINGVALVSGILGFDQKTYKIVEYIEPGWFWSRRSKKRQYINSCKLISADYVFELEGIDKGASLAHSIAKELSARTHDTYEKHQIGYVIPQTKEHPGYMIEYTNDDVTIKVTLGETSIQET